MNNATPKDPIIKRAKVKGTGLPIDGHTLTFGFWAYDGHKQPHLLDWEKDADEAVMKTMHQTDELYSKMPLEEICRIVDERAHVPRPHTGGYTLENKRRNHGRRVFGRMASA